jgi:hypothetical protein
MDGLNDCYAQTKNGNMAFQHLLAFTSDLVTMKKTFLVLKYILLSTYLDLHLKLTNSSLCDTSDVFVHHSMWAVSRWVFKDA